MSHFGTAGQAFVLLFVDVPIFVVSLSCLRAGRRLQPTPGLRTSKYNSERIGPNVQQPDRAASPRRSNRSEEEARTSSSRRWPIASPSIGCPAGGVACVAFAATPGRRRAAAGADQSARGRSLRARTRLRGPSGWGSRGVRAGRCRPGAKGRRSGCPAPSTSTRTRRTVL